MPERIESAAAAIRAGGVVAYPTEAVFGLGCDPRNEHAVRRVLALKGRPPGKGLILIAADLHQLIPYLAPLPHDLLERVRASWPGPVTWLLPARPHTPSWLTGRHHTLAVRVTAHPLAAALCCAARTALVSTSANRAGRPPVRHAAEVRALFGAQLDAVIDAPVGGLKRPSEIRDAHGRIIRPGN
ncbi:MAG: L-threonylcarbamoyladenylate synthase [Gammaproteobacteria bacterium]|jgi:L-threonylcarbamoyladenylate synthase